MTERLATLLALLNTSRWEDEQLLLRLYRDKTVAIVGPAGYLEEYDVTEAVRSADVVVRPNCRVDVDRRVLLLPKRTSTRCDVVYHSGLALGERQQGPAGRMIATGHSSALSNGTLAVYAAHGVNAIVMTELRRQRLVHFQQLAPPTTLALLTPRPFVLAAHQFHTGMKALLDVLRHRPRRVLIFGYDFYQTQKRAYRGYYSELERRAVVPEVMGNAAWHNTEAELAHFRDEVLARHPEVVVDDHLKWVLAKWSTTRARTAHSR